jgi:predicted dehydrogenase
MLERESLDAVVVAVPNVYHADCAIAALDADVNVLVEKPLAHDVEAAERIERAEAASDATVVVGFMRPFAPHVDAVNDRIDNGEFGDVYEVNLEYIRRRGIPHGSWFASEATAGGGAVIDIGVHVLHLGLHLLDFPEIESVTASAGAHFGPDQTDEFDVEDSAHAFVRTADDTTLTLRCAWASNTEPSRGVQILGDEAGATFSIMENEATVFSSKDGGQSNETLQFPPLPGADRLSFDNGGTFTAEWQYFDDVAAGERAHTRNTVEEGLAVQRLIEAIYQSAETRSTVSP